MSKTPDPTLPTLLVSRGRKNSRFDIERAANAIEILHGALAKVADYDMSEHAREDALECWYLTLSDFVALKRAAKAALARAYI